MPTAQARALSLMEQQALELISLQVSSAAQNMFIQASNGKVSEEELSKSYAALIAGGMIAVAGARVSYLQGFAKANGERPFDIPSGVLRPSPADVLVSGIDPAETIPYVSGLQRKWAGELTSQRDSMLKKLQESVADGVESANDSYDALSDAEIRRRANIMAGNRLGSLAESTVTSTADFVTRSVLLPNKKVGALRRVVHPGACERCQAVAQVMTFVFKPRLRHDQCRCSFEPVYVTDPQYQGRLAQYRDTAAGRTPGPLQGGRRTARDARSRGRRQLAAAQSREDSEGLRSLWDEFLQNEDRRSNNLVKSIKSNTFKDWDVMVAASSSKIAGDVFPVLTRA